MKHLFSPEGRAALAAVMERQPLLAFDFDGTLAPIVLQWDDAQVEPEIAARLAQLNEKLPMAILSGRCVADVRGRLRLPACHVLGSHGIEDPDDPVPAHVLSELHRLRQRVESDQDWLQGEGILLEDKGVSLSLHYRLASDPARAESILKNMLDEFASLSIVGGKLVVNVMPAGLGDKGTAILKVLSRAGKGAAVYFGDDLNDEPVFVGAQPNWVTVRVGRDFETSAAKFFLEDITEMAQALDLMVSLAR